MKNTQDTEPSPVLLEPSPVLLEPSPVLLDLKDGSGGCLAENIPETIGDPQKIELEKKMESLYDKSIKIDCEGVCVVKKYLSIFAIVLAILCVCLCTMNINPGIVFTVKLERGWSKPKHFVLYQNGLLKVYSGCDSLMFCTINATNCLIYSEKLSDQTFTEIVETWDHLPSCLPDSFISFDGPRATFQKDGNEYSFYLSSQVNSELSSFVISLMEITQGTEMQDRGRFSVLVEKVMFLKE